MINPDRPAPVLTKLPEVPGKRPYCVEIPGVHGRLYCTVEELQSLADQLNDELDALVQS